ncbi:PLC-like phosphodiesterase [Pisolithus marmoratus]|nr:PLC-like phosphodiesterase [Pisolithus marmoratus]
MTTPTTDKRNHLQTAVDNLLDRPSAPQVRSSASLSESFSVQVTNDGLWITRKLKNFSESLIDNMLQASPVDCVDDTGSSDKHTVTCFGLNGQATNLFPATNTALSCKGGFVAKVFWVEEARKSELELLKKMYKITAWDEDVRGHIPDMVYYQAFQDTDTAVIRNRLGLKADGAHILYLTLLVGSDFLHAWWATVKCHLGLWKNGVYHGDVSPPNIMYKQIADGTIAGGLHDFDIALIEVGPTGTVCAGTVPFMALALLSERGLDGQIKHSYEHDVESFIWTLTWVTLRYDNGALRTTGRPLDEWLAVDALSCRKKRTCKWPTSAWTRWVLLQVPSHFPKLRVKFCRHVLCRMTLHSSLSQEELRTVFLRYAKRSEAKAATIPTSPSLPSSPSDNGGDITIIYQDMTQPLRNYSSSHNTYLVGHQLVGDSTIEGYIRALLQVDIYDGDNEPMVFRGKTLTSKMRVREVCEAISKYAFVTSPYPVIISAEQNMLVAIMHDVFREALVSAPIGEHPKTDKLPSLEELKGKVLLKAKNLYVSEGERVRTKEVVLDTESSSTETSTSDSDIAQEAEGELRRFKNKISRLLKLNRAAECGVLELKEEFRKDVFNRVRGYYQVPEKSVTTALVGAATAISTAIAEPPIKSGKQDTKVKIEISKKETYAPEHVFSLSENTADKIMKQGMMDLIKHNKDHLIGIYPKGLRLNSTNYLPHRYWAAGAQLVALNWQTFDLGTMVNHAMFQRNGRAGYILKPEALRLPDKGVLAPRTPHHLDVTFSQQLPRPKDSTGHEIVGRNIVDPYAEVSIYTPDWTHFSFPSPSSGSSPPLLNPSGSSGSGTTRTITARTSSVKNNGFNPIRQESLRLSSKDGENDGEPICGVLCQFGDSSYEA